MIVISDVLIKSARSEHICSLCGRTIRAGESYRKARIIGDDPYTWKQCAHCTALLTVACPDSLREDIEWAIDCDGYNDDTIYEWEPIGPAEKRLKFRFQRRWSSLDGYLYPVPTADDLDVSRLDGTNA